MQNKKLEKIRKKYPKFVYQDFSYKFVKPNLKIWFDFYIPPKFNFRTKIVIKNCPKSLISKDKEERLNNFIFHLGLIEMLNYWKLSCSPLIKIKAGFLNKEQTTFLKKIILKGMGQYFYENKIDFTKKNFIKIESNKNSSEKNKKRNNTLRERMSLNKVLVPIGGGKDSPVTIDILKNKKNFLGSFILNPKKPQLDINKIAQLKETILVNREIDKKLLKMNKQGFLNGHVPFSAFLSFLSLLTAFIFDYKEIAFSWEKSSDQGNLKYKNKEINHQWSKSSEFEKMLNRYSKKYLSKDIKIFSPIKNLYELQIIQHFAKLPQYHSSFLSCNMAYRKGAKLNWCGKCPKCLFVFASLYPFVGQKKTIKIFNKNLFEDKDLIPLLEELTGEKGFKPFDCVGTKEESLVIFYLSLKKFQQETKRKKMPILLEYFEKNILPKHPEIKKLTDKLMAKNEK